MWVIVNTIILKVQGIMNNEQVETETRGNYCIIRRCKTSLQSPCPLTCPPISDRICAVIGGQMINIAVTVGALVTTGHHWSLGPSFSQPAPAQLWPPVPLVTPGQGHWANTCIHNVRSFPFILNKYQIDTYNMYSAEIRYWAREYKKCPPICPASLTQSERSAL